MWAHLVAAETPAPGISEQLIIVVGGVITAAIVALGGVLVAVVNSRASRTTPSPPSPLPEPADHALYERTAVLTRRADDNDDRDDMQDRRFERSDDRLDALERYNDRRDPDWRH